MNRAPIRIRVAAAFSVAMAVVLALAGALVYTRSASHLARNLDLQLQVRAQDLGLFYEQPGASIGEAGSPRFFEPGESYSQLIDARGRVVDQSTSLENTGSLLTDDELQRALALPVLRGPRARGQAIFTNRDSVPGLDEPSRILATPVRRQPGEARAARGANP